MPIATRKARVFASPEELRAWLRGDDETDTVGDVTTQEMGDDLGAAPRMEPTEGGYSLTIGDETLSADSRDEAFQLLEASDWFASAVGRKNADAPTWDRFAPGRWLDAASVEDLPSSIDGSQIREHMIGEMARNLSRAKTPVPVDGGGVSGVHESVVDSAAKAAGWAFAGVEVIDREGRSHVWLYVRLHPDVDAQIEEGQLLYGSIAFVGEDADRYGEGESIGARLISYALTNTPFVDGLEPHAPRERSKQLPAGRWLAITRSHPLMENQMPKSQSPKPLTGEALAEKVRGLAAILDVADPAHAWERATARSAAIVREAHAETTRGPAQDKLAELAGFLGLDLEDAEEPYGKVYDAVYALQQAASAEGVLEGMGLAGAPDVGDDDEGERSGDPDPAAGHRVLDAFEGEDAQDTWTQSVLDWLRSLFDQPEADPAAVLEMAAASTDAFKGALGGGDDMADDAGPGGQDEGDRSVRAAEAIGLRAEVKSLTAKLEKLTAEQRSRDINDHIAERFRAAGLVTEDGKAALTEEDHAELVAMCERAGDDWKRPVETALRWRNMPPMGEVSAPKGAGTTAPGGEPANVDEALAAAQAELKAKGEKLTKKQLRSQSYAMAKSRWPEIFRASLKGDKAD